MVEPSFYRLLQVCVCAPVHTGPPRRRNREPAGIYTKRRLWAARLRRQGGFVRRLVAWTREARPFRRLQHETRQKTAPCVFTARQRGICRRDLQKKRQIFGKLPLFFETYEIDTVDTVFLGIYIKCRRRLKNGFAYYFRGNGNPGRADYD